MLMGQGSSKSQGKVKIWIHAFAGMTEWKVYGVRSQFTLHHFSINEVAGNDRNKTWSVPYFFMVCPLFFPAQAAAGANNDGC